MKLLRKLTWCSAVNNFFVRAEHVPGKYNDISDSLSRLQMERFESLAPQAERSATQSVSPLIRPDHDLADSPNSLWQYALAPGTAKTHQYALHQFLQFLALSITYASQEDIRGYSDQTYHILFKNPSYSGIHHQCLFSRNSFLLY